MSHYIQDNQAVIKTTDNHFMLFIKGGDNNVSSASSNKRCTSWHFVGSFENKEAYDSYVDVVMQSDINGGMWQFQSLKNKHFEGYTEYDLTVYKRFDTALKKAISIDWVLSDTTSENVVELENLIVAAFASKNINMKNQDGQISLPKICLYYDKDEMYEKGASRARKFINYSDKVVNNRYREFCYKWAKTTPFECFSNLEFLSEMIQYRSSWNGYEYYLNGAIKLTKEHLATMFLKHPKKLLNMGSWDREKFLKLFPQAFKDFVDDTNIIHLLKETQKEEAQKDDVSEYSIEEHNKCIEDFVEFSQTTYKDLISDAKLREEEERANAPKDFIKVWNDLLARTFYKNTNSLLPDSMRKLNSLFDSGAFSLADVADECVDDFYKIIGNHRNQYKKNQKPVKELATLLISKYSELLDKRSVDTICDYFGLSIPSKKIDENILVVGIAPQNPTPQECFKNGTLF